MNKPEFSVLNPKVVLGVGAHPDDIDYCAGGTMAAFAKSGAKVYYLILTDGGSGSSDPSMTSERLRDLRREEQRKAGRAFGLADVFFLDYRDGELENTLAVKRDVVKIIRQVKPDVLVALDPTFVYSTDQGMINHPDHRAAGQASLDAVFPLARDHMTFPDLLEQGYEPHKTPHVLLARFGNESTNYGVDITNTFEQKIQAITKHTSQFSDQDKIASQLRNMATDAGKMYGAKYAEAFVRIDVN